MVFPKEVIDYSAERHRFRHSRKRQTIYTVLLLLLIMLLVASSFLSLNVYATARGMIRSSVDNVVIRATISGTIDSLLVNENDLVVKDMPLIILNKELLLQQIGYTSQQIDSLRLQITDLQQLIDEPYGTGIQGSKTIQLQQSFLQHRKGLHRATHQHRIKLTRDKQLYAKGVISKVDLELSTYEFDQARNKLISFEERNFLSWKEQLEKLQNEYNKYELQLQKLQYSKNQYVLRSPVKGSVLSIQNCKSGLFHNAGEPLIEISTRDQLMVEVYVTDRDINFLRIGQPAFMVVDALRSSYRSKLTGYITHIQDDLTFLDNQPFYKVICEIRAEEFNESEDILNQLRKGMSLQVQFLKKRSSFYEILWNKIQDQMPKSYGL